MDQLFSFQEQRQQEG
ncbi:hypothetical protein LINGRAHAP2_LOCUS6268 [Linum grandiflorum]